MQGNRVSTESDTITIRIGGIDEYGNEVDHSTATKAPKQNIKQSTTRWKRTKRNKSSIANNRISTTNCKCKILKTKQAIYGKFHVIHDLNTIEHVK